MIDNRIPLPKGTVLIGESGIRYTLTESSVGKGGNSLVYPAVREGSGRLFAIKECFPLSDEHEFIRRNWVVCAEEDSGTAAKYLEARKAGMALENEVGQAIANCTGRAIAPWETLHAQKLIVDGNTFDATGGAFVVMERAKETIGEGEGSRSSIRGWSFRELMEECERPRQEGYPLRSGGLPSPYVTVRIMEELLKPLRDIHRAGYIHGDVQDGNLFFMGPDLEAGDIGVGQLLDFGNARPIGRDGLTPAITDRHVFSTPGYWSPEILTGNDGTLRLSPATDVYSAGCMLLYLIKGMSFKDSWGMDFALCDSLVGPVTRRRVEQRGFKRDAACLVVKVLDKALAQDPKDRYGDAGEMLKEICALKKLVQPPRFRLPANLSRSPYFVEQSRDRELARLREELDAGKHPLWIWGIWGIGKTELAMEFARRQMERGMDAHLVSFRGTMKETILHMDFSGYQFQHDGRGDATEQEYRERLDILKEGYEGSLLIIDNFECEGTDIAQLQQEEAYRDIAGLNLHLLFTTRTRPDRVTPELQPLGEDDAIALYESIAEIGSGEREDVLALLREVRCHPLAVELSAHAVENDWGEGNVSPKILLSKFRSGRIAQLDGVSGSREEVGIYTHIRSLFTVFNLDDSYREVLCHTTLLPLDGMDAGVFLSGEAGPLKTQLKKLEGHGWIRRGRENLLWIHPLVRTVFKNELKPTDKDCDGFLSSLWERIEERHLLDMDICRQSAELFTRAAFDLENGRGDYSAHAGHCSFAIGQTAQAFLHANETIQIREALQPCDDRALASAYNDAGAIALAMFDGEEALVYFTKALTILKTYPDCAELADVYINLGTVYSELEDYESAIEYGRKALKILESTPQKNKFLLPSAHNVLALALAGAKNYGEAIWHMDAAIGLSEALMPNGHPSLAALYCNAGNVYGLAGDFSKALELLKKGVRLQEELLPWDHADIIASYMTLAEVYRLLGEEAEAGRYACKASEATQSKKRDMWRGILNNSMRILEQAEGTMSKESLAQRYRSVAEAHRQLGSYEEATEYIGKAIHELAAGTSDPMQQVLNFATASDIWNDRKDCDTALSYAEQAFQMVTEHFPEDYDNRSTYALKVGGMYRKQKKSEQALAYYQSAVSYQMKCPYPDRSMIQIAQTAVGNILTEMGRYDEGKKCLKEVFDARSSALPEFHADVREAAALLENVDRRIAEATTEK